MLSRRLLKVFWLQYRTKMATTSSTFAAIQELQNNPYYEKYSKKITALQYTSEELKLKLKEHHEKTFKSKQNSPEGGHFSTISEPKEDTAMKPTHTKQKLLNDVMRISMIADKSNEEIKQIWMEYHKQKHMIVATISSAMYDVIYSRSLRFPIFLFPLPRDKGYEFILCQFSGHEAHFTPLIVYQAHKENASECLVMTHYVDLKNRGLVLMRGEYDKDSLNSIEAQCLANQLQLYYGQENEKRTKLLERFIFRPQEFKHMDLIAELESLTL